MSDEFKKALIGVGTTAITAIGTIGFVAFTGAAIAWVRFYSAQLPADQAVAAMPRSELVAIGGAALVLFVLLGAVAVLFLYVVDPGANDVEGVRWALLLLAILEVIAAIVIATDGDESWGPSLKAAGFVVLVGAITFSAFLSKWTSTWAEFTPLGSGEGLSISNMAKYRVYRRKLKPLGWFIVIAAMAAVIGLTPQIMSENADGRWAVAAVLATAVVLAIANFAVAHATGNRFWAAAIAVFFSVLVFGAVLAAARTFQAPLVQPAAVIRSGDLRYEGILALYVTETSDRVWLAVVCQQEDAENRPEPNMSRVFWVPKKDVVAMSIGPLQRLSSALENAPKLLDSQIALRIPPAKAATRATRNPGDQPPVRAFNTCGVPKNKPPDVSVAVRRIAGAPRVYLLDASRSSDPDGSVASYAWTLPGDKTSDRAVVLHRMFPGQRRAEKITVSVSDNDGDASEATIELRPPIAARALFKIDRAKLRSGARGRLRERLRDVRAAGTKDLIFVQVDGHTDSTASQAHNQRLSERRAAAVAAFLRKLLKIDDERMRPPRGFGETVPVASNETPRGRRLNRRVEVLVVRRSG